MVYHTNILVQNIDSHEVLALWDLQNIVVLHGCCTLRPPTHRFAQSFGILRPPKHRFLRGFGTLRPPKHWFPLGSGTQRPPKHVCYEVWALRDLQHISFYEVLAPTPVKHRFLQSFSFEISKTSVFIGLVPSKGTNKALSLQDLGSYRTS